jgi:isoleucyl-tRNA synthetase
VEYLPGWDCHGLPIELKALKSKSEDQLSAAQVRGIAKRFAEKTVQNQFTEFKDWCVMADWQNSWTTMGTSS